jgi:DNA-binding transcriptional LysR family regulator
MNTERLRTFGRVARIGSFRRAAEELNLSQPAVSKQIRALETDLGAQLFERGHPVRLTPAGDTLLGYAERMDVLMRTAREELSDLVRVEMGQLRIGMSHSASLHVVPRAVARYRTQFPHVRLYLETNWATDLLSQVRRNDLDLAIVGLVDPHQQDVTDLHSEVLATSDIVFATSASGPLVTGPSVSLDEARALPWIVNHTGCQYRAFLDDLFKGTGLFRGTGQTMRPAAEIVGLDLQRRLVQLGIGVSLFAEMAIEEDLAAGTLQRFHIASLRPRTHLCLLYRKTKYIHHAMRGFLDLLAGDTPQNGRGSSAADLGMLAASPAQRPHPARPETGRKRVERSKHRG